jgi:hypothetical protein
MSYTEYLRRSLANQPKIIDTSMSLPDASSYTWRQKMKAGRQVRPTDHVITNVFDPSITPNLYTKKTMVYRGTGYGGKVQDASDWTLTRSVTAIGGDNFTSGKIQTACCSLRPPASQIINENGNAYGVKTGLNMGHVSTCAPVFTPQSKSYFVDTIPEIKTHKIGILPASGWNGAQDTHYGTQLPITTCKDTNTHGPQKLASGLLLPKDEKSVMLHSARPNKLDFVTAITGPQISQNGAYGRAPKVGNALRKIPYVEKHHGRAWGPRPVPSKFKPTTGAPAQLKINEPTHYFVA